MGTESIIGSIIGLICCLIPLAILILVGFTFSLFGQIFMMFHS